MIRIGDICSAVVTDCRKMGESQRCVEKGGFESGDVDSNSYQLM